MRLKPRNRRKQGERRWRLPALDWRRLATTLASLAALAAAVGGVAWALDQPIETIIGEGRVQRVSPLACEHAVKRRVVEIQKTLPPGVIIDPIYDRSDFVGRTLSTVMKNLVEGVLVVTFVLALLLGTVRGALVVVAGIPASMAIALFGMHLFGVTGDLMSLGAIDFGFLVDGPIVILEAVMAAASGAQLASAARARAYAKIAASVARPVAFAVAIIMLVYLALLTL